MASPTTSFGEVCRNAVRATDEWVWLNVESSGFNVLRSVASSVPSLASRSSEPHVEAVSKFHAEGRLMRLVRPLIFTMRREEDHWVGEEPKTGLIAAGANLADVRTEMLAELAFLWTHYAMADDARLAPSARNLKHELLQMVVRT